MGQIRTPRTQDLQTKFLCLLWFIFKIHFCADKAFYPLFHSTYINSKFRVQQSLNSRVKNYKRPKRVKHCLYLFASRIKTFYSVVSVGQYGFAARTVGATTTHEVRSTGSLKYWRTNLISFAARRSTAWGRTQDQGKVFLDADRLKPANKMFIFSYFNLFGKTATQNLCIGVHSLLSQ